MSGCQSATDTAAVEVVPCAAAPAETGEDEFGDGALAEGARMAEAMALPTAIDPDYVHHSSSGVLTGSRLMVTAGHNNEVADAAEDHGLLAGFVSTRFAGDARSQDSRWLTHAIMRFRDSASACAAATDLAAAAERSRGMWDTADREPAPLPGEADTHFGLRDQSGRLDGLAITSYRDYVVYTEVRDRDRAAIERVITRALELQRPLLDSFAATPVPELARLPYDPDGVFALSVGANATGPGAYGQRGAVLFAEDQVAAARLYPELGVSAMANKGTTVYRAADSAGAARLRGFLAETIAAAHGKTVAPAPAEQPETSCLSDGRDHPNAWTCVVSAGPYVAEAWGRSQDETHQLVREQRAVLAAAE
ncbi:DUF7373 family lipoprotein [Nocardia sienata]|uniref:DUF7373 family lipoprotein n=1 Tax=Nocardia sienata TaxID=248552 RepID=UPI0012ECCCAF|nr:hypothetical protein [Nocardia sienata]